MKQGKFLLTAWLAFVLIGNTAKAAETEPNNNKATANTLALNGSNSGKINPAGDQDWWSVTTSGDGKLNITLTPLSGKYIWVYLYDNDGTTQLNASYSKGAFTQSTDGLAAGTYYIKVVCYYNSDTASYNISNTLTIPMQANDVEPNDTKAQAKVLPLNGSKTGHIGYYYNVHRDSADWYKVTTNADGLLRLSLTPANGDYVWIYLYDNDGTTLLNSSYDDAPFTQSTDGLAAGTYYVKVKCYYNNKFAPYTLSDSLFIPAQANDTEPNDLRAQALTLSQNSTATGHVGYYFNIHRDTADWYKVTTTDDGLLKLKLTPANGEYVWIYLYDNNGTTLLNSSYDDAPFTQSTDGLAAGTYYVKVKCYYSSKFAPYTLTDSLLTYENAGDEEINNKAYLAKTILANGTTTGHIGFYYDNVRDTFDWHRINYTGSGALTVTMNLESTKTDGIEYTYMEIWKDTLASAIYSKYTQGASLVANLTSLAQGYYWVRIRTYYNSKFSSYSLTPTFTQVNVAKIKLVTPEQPADCSSTNSLKFNCSGSQSPYTIQLYRFGAPYGSPVVVTKTKTFKNLPHGYYYATAYGDGATGTAFGTSKAITLVPTPTNAGTTNITSTKAKFNWITQSCASYYQVQYRVHGNATWTTKKTAGNVSSYVAKNLAPGTLYEWRVASADTSNGMGGIGAYTDSLPFTTATSFSVDSESNDDAVLATTNSKTEFSVYPNPATNYFLIHVTGSVDTRLNATLVDMNGKAVWASGLINAVSLINKRVNTNGLAKGIYYLRITDENNSVMTVVRLVIL